MEDRIGIDGVELAFSDRGQGRPVLFLHGSCSDHRLWAPHARLAAPRYRCIALSQRYFGTSAWPDEGAGFSLATHAADLVGFITALGVAPACLVGWSYGAAVALAAARASPGSVAGLFLYEPALTSHLPSAAQARRAGADRRAMLAAAADAVSAGDGPASVRAFVDGVNGRSGSFAALDDRQQGILLENWRSLPLLLAAPPADLAAADLARIAAPALVARGAATRPYYRLASDAACACLGACRALTVSGARHLWPVTAPRAFVAALDRFLESP